MKKWTPVIIFALSGLLVLILITRSGDEPKAAGEGKYALTYSGSFLSIAPGTQEFRAWIPLISTREGQRVLERKITLPFKYEIYTDKLFNNEMLYFETKNPPPQIPFKIEYKVKTSGQIYEHAKKEEPELKHKKAFRGIRLAEETAALLRRETPPSHSIKQKARTLFDFSSRPERGHLRRSDPEDPAEVFAAGAFEIGLPVLIKTGFDMPDEAEAGTVLTPSYAWVNYYIKNEGWYPAYPAYARNDPSGSPHYFNRFNPNAVILSVGRDIRLEPKSANLLRRTFVKPYAESDNRRHASIKLSVKTA